MGMKGAAMATVKGSLITSLVLLTHFIKKKNRIKICIKGISFDMVKKIISCVSSSFLMEVASGFVIFIFNIQILKYIGDNGIVIYGIISNCIIVGISLFNGIAQASQPIIATNHGADEVKRVRNVLKYAMYTTIAIGIILFAIVCYSICFHKGSNISFCKSRRIYYKYGYNTYKNVFKCILDYEY